MRSYNVFLWRPVFFDFAFREAACLSADKNLGIKPDVEDEWVPQPLSPISGEHRREKRPGKHVGELSLLPSSVTGRIKAEKVCGEDKREGWLADMGKNKTCWKKGSRVKHYWFYNSYFQRDVGAFGLLTNYTVTEPTKKPKDSCFKYDKKAGWKNDFSTQLEAIIFKWVRAHTYERKRCQAPQHSSLAGFQFQRCAERH